MENSNNKNDNNNNNNNNNNTDDETIDLYGNKISEEVFGKMVVKNDSHRFEGYNCRACDKYTYYGTPQTLANHITKEHPNDSKWDASNMVKNKVYSNQDN